MKDPEERAKELCSTGVPTPFVVEYESLIENPRSIESDVHQVLSQYREGKEFFRCQTIVAIEAIRQCAPLILYDRCQRDTLIELEERKAEADRIQKDKDRQEQIAQRHRDAQIQQIQQDYEDNRLKIKTEEASWLNHMIELKNNLDNAEAEYQKIIKEHNRSKFKTKTVYLTALGISVLGWWYIGFYTIVAIISGAFFYEGYIEKRFYSSKKYRSAKELLDRRNIQIKTMYESRVTRGSVSFDTVDDALEHFDKNSTSCVQCGTKTLREPITDIPAECKRRTTTCVACHPGSYKSSLESGMAIVSTIKVANNDRSAA